MKRTLSQPPPVAEEVHPSDFAVAKQGGRLCRPGRCAVAKALTQDKIDSMPEKFRGTCCGGTKQAGQKEADGVGCLEPLLPGKRFWWCHACWFEIRPPVETPRALLKSTPSVTCVTEEQRAGIAAKRRAAMDRRTAADLDAALDAALAGAKLPE